MPRDREELQPLAAVDALVLPPLRATRHDDRHVGEGLHGVHQRGLAPQAEDPGEGRLVPRLATVPFHALDERGLLAEYVAPGRSEDVEHQPTAGAQDVLADQALLAQVLDLGVQHGLFRAVLVPDEHPTLLGAGDDHAHQQALEHQVRLLGQELAVLKGARLGLVGVADGVLHAALGIADQLPLLAGREARASHATKQRSPEGSR